MPAIPAPPLPHVAPEPEPKTPAPGLAAVKHAQELERRAALMMEAKNTAQAFRRQYAEGSSLGELYQYYKHIGRLETFFALFGLS